ncbi:hypothetical protein I79_001201 [Cricetulus griseus]|uniref:Uncharacterized protein n=1 Tax=Cricetulus griseus TaxID=10029 RepID=G3GU52_CRIGR|nr:hypothetical protein I79_001201 [Cricetulus griseus]
MAGKAQSPNALTALGSVSCLPFDLKGRGCSPSRLLGGRLLLDSTLVRIGSCCVNLGCLYRWVDGKTTPEPSPSQPCCGHNYLTACSPSLF